MKHLPNILTALRIVSAPFLWIFAAQRHYASAALVFFLSSWTDFFDGQIARRCHAVSKLGTLLDPVADKLFVLCSYLALWKDFKGLAMLVIGRDVAILLGVALARRLRLNLPIRPLMISKINTAFAMLFPFVWLLFKMQAHGTAFEKGLVPILIACGMALITTLGLLSLKPFRSGASLQTGLLGLGGLAVSFALWYAAPVQKGFAWLLSPELLTFLSGLVLVTTVASGLAYAQVFLKAWRNASETE